MSLVGLCRKCVAPPNGIDGHDDLHAHSQGDGRKGMFRFRCSACGARWSRRYSGEGKFAWTLEEVPADSPTQPGDE